MANYKGFTGICTTESIPLTNDLIVGIRAFQKNRFQQAKMLLEPLARGGEVRAQMIMARLYYGGNGVEQDLVQYQYWLQQAADNGDKSAKSLVKRYAKKSKGLVDDI